MNGIVTDYTNTRTTASLLASLQSAGVGTVVDVRLNPNLPFNNIYPRKGALTTLLPNFGIKYAHLVGLGNKYRDLDNIESSKASYQRDVASHPDFFTLLSMIDDRDNGTMCLLCYCKPPNPCHRFWLLEMLQR